MRSPIFSGLVLCMLCGQVNAHFLWLVAHPDGKPGEVHAYFSETAAPDDPELLAKFLDMTATQKLRTRNGATEQLLLRFQLSGGTLAAPLTDNGSSPIVAQQTYGVVTRGGESFLLQYHAKAYPVPLPGTWQPVADKTLAALEITPSITANELSLQITWQGEPAAGDQVVIEGPGLDEKLQGTTDAEGLFRCRLPATGLFSIRARHIEQKPGTLGEERYASIRHYATLALPYSSPTAVIVNQETPNLPRGVTSFGAAVAGEYAYVYGGHFGDAHHYSSAGQSNEFWRLPLRTKSPAWESLPSGPKLTGLALVAHEANLYRVGGFTAKNDEKNEQDLWSQDGFAMFDPAVGTWTDRAPLPEPRSSHDAAVLDGKLYVVGGWNMAGGKETAWHDTAWVCDLNAEPLAWSQLPQPPFHRRALSLAAHDGKLYVLGGMQESGKPTTQIDVFDPATQTWSVGAPLIGTGMEGFGNSSFAWNGRLVATTMSGSVQQLAADGTHWSLIGQLKHPRFFHRQLVTPTGDLLILGGASMQTGKTNSVELLRAAAE